MADRIKGITVEIGGDTTGLSKALSGVNKEIRNTQSQLTDVGRLLKLDPTNSELLSQKQKLLSQAVGETKEKLTVFAAAGGWLGYFLGGCDGLLYALLIFVICDYITGVMGAISDKKLSSAVGFRGICRKVLIFILVGIANVIDINVLGQVGVLRTAVIFFYISNEGLSLIENAAHLGLPIPGKLKEVLEQLHNRDEKDTDKEEK